MLIVGEKEAVSGTVSVRKQGEGDRGIMKLEDFCNFIKQEINKELA